MLRVLSGASSQRVGLLSLLGSLICRSLRGCLGEHPRVVPNNRPTAVRSPVCTLRGCAFLADSLAVDEGEFPGMGFGTLYSSYEGPSAHAAGGFLLPWEGRVILGLVDMSFFCAVSASNRLSWEGLRGGILVSVRGVSCRGPSMPWCSLVARAGQRRSPPHHARWPARRRRSGYRSCAGGGRGGVRHRWSHLEDPHTVGFGESGCSHVVVWTSRPHPRWRVPFVIGD